jgi:hypothetical protein
MSVAALGALLGGYQQGQQNAEAQRERAAYLLSLQQRQARLDANEDAAQEAKAGAAFDLGDKLTFSNDQPAGTDGSTLGTDGEGGGPVSRVFGANAAPLTGPGAPTRPAPQPPMGGGPGGAPAMPPGTASMPAQPPQQMAMPGATPMLQQGRPMPPPQMQRPPVQPMMQGQPGGPGAAPPMAQARQPQPGPPPQAQQAPQTPQDGFQQAIKTLNDANQRLSTPEAQAVLQDPDVQDVRKRYHAYVEKLRADGVDPTGQTGRKPDLVEMNRLQIYQSELGASMASASKHLGDDRKQQWEYASGLSKVYAQQQVAQLRTQNVQDQIQGRKDAAAIRASGAGGAAGNPGSDFNSWSPEQKAQLVREYNQFGPAALPWARSMKGGSQQIEAFDKYRFGGGDAPKGNRAEDTADMKANQASLTNVTKAADTANQRYKALDSNISLALSQAQKYGLGGATPINEVLNRLRGTTDPNAKAFLSAIATVQREYGKLADGGSGAAAAHVESLKQAGDILNSNFTLPQLQAVAATLKKDGQNVLDSYADQIKTIKGRQAQTARGSAAPSTGGDAYKGHSFSSDDVARLAAQASTTPDVMRKFIEGKGGSIGN